MSVKSSQFQVIENIRKNKGIGSGKGTGDNEKSLHRAIKRLSEDLYSKDVHFILELIQNAEDNKYLPDKDPQLIFKILLDDPTKTPEAQGALLVVNNEIGFQAKDIQIICDIGASEKTKREGYIGEKGIGFKSVFLVTSKPHIFSAGFQFFFQDEEDPEVGFGYIIPYWVADPPKIVQKQMDQTCILLPLRAGKINTIENELQQIAPETILFLKKIRAIKIAKEDTTLAEVYRVDGDYPKVELHTDGTKKTYWLTVNDMPVREGLKEEKRQGITSREITVAFPLETETAPEIGVFAYLPTSPSLVSGLDFLINADFLLSSNREQIQEHLAWNQWLRDSIPSTFLAGFESMLQDKELRIKAYSYIPIEKANRSPFFTPVVTDILKDLRERPIILTQDGEWVIPAQARFASKEVRKLFAGDCLPAQLSETKLVWSELESQDYRERLKSIGVKDLTEKEIVNCLNDRTWISQKDMAWFLDLYHYLQGQNWANKKVLAQIALVPLTDKTIHRPSEYTAIYLPTPAADKIVKNNKEVIQLCGNNFLNASLYKVIHDEPKIEEWAKENLNLWELNVPRICQDLVLELERKIDEIDTKFVIWATRFICDHYPELGQTDQYKIMQHLPLVLSTGSVIRRADIDSGHNLVFPENFDKQTGWQFVFPDPEDRVMMDVLSKQYLENVEKEDFEKWEEFFGGIGATRYPPPPIKTSEDSWYLSNISQNVSPHHKEWLNKYRKYAKDFSLQDWRSPGWLKKLNTLPPRTQAKHAKALLDWLEAYMRDSNRGYYFNKIMWTEASLSWRYRSQHDETNQSEMDYHIRNTPWVPTTKGLRKPSEVFVERIDIKETLGNEVPYLKIKISDDLVRWLKVRTSATFAEILQLIKDLAKGSSLVLNHKLISKLYAFLNERWDYDKNSDAKADFESQPLIYVANPAPRWCKVDEVIWPDRREVTEDAFGYLEPEYGSLKGFFVDKLGVKKDLDDEAYEKAWLNLSASNVGFYDAAKMKSALEKIYLVMLRNAKSEVKPRWWSTFIKKAKVWTRKDHFVSSAQIFIPDDNDLEKAFKDTTVEYPWRPPKDGFADYLPLFSALGIQSLADSVQVKALNTGESIQPNQKAYLTDEVKRAICAYIFTDFRDTYNDIKEKGLLTSLLMTKECSVERLNLALTLPGIQTEISDGIAFWDHNKNIFYHSSHFTKSRLMVEIPTIISRKFLHGSDAKALEDFIGRILNAPSESIHDILKKRNLTLPIAESKWVNQLLKAPVDPEEVVTFQTEDDLLEEVKQESSENEELSPLRYKISLGEPNKTTGEKKRLSRHQGISPKPNQKSVPTPPDKQSRLRSYVYPDGEKSSQNESPEINKRKKEIGRIGVTCVMNYEKEEGRHPTDMETIQTNHPGYDIESRDGDGNPRYIEVKSFSGSWRQNPAEVTKSEFETAKKYGEDFWLYVVEYAGTDNFQIHQIQNPANRVTHYLFDDGWIIKD